MIEAPLPNMDFMKTLQKSRFWWVKVIPKAPNPYTPNKIATEPPRMISRSWAHSSRNLSLWKYYILRLMT